MNAHKQLIPYGLWQSLITPELVGQGIRFPTCSGRRAVSAWCGANPKAARLP